jgi:DNA-directed RNA polymerase-5 subunit 1
LAIFEPFSLSLLGPDIIKLIPAWTITQTVEGALPTKLCCEREYLVDHNIKKLDIDKVHVDVSFYGFVSSLLSKKGQGETPFFECFITIVDGVFTCF